MRRWGESGATLVELLAAITILTLIGGVLTESLIVGIRATERTKRHVSESLDRQLLSTLFVQDVQSSDTVLTEDLEVCSEEPLEPEQTVKVSLKWNDGKDRLATYFVDTTERRLYRRFCIANAANVVAEDKLSASLADSEEAVRVDCPPLVASGATTTSSTTTTTAPAYPCPSEPSKVRIRVRDGTYQDCATAGKPERCEFTLEAFRRVSEEAP